MEILLTLANTWLRPESPPVSMEVLLKILKCVKVAISATGPDFKEIEQVLSVTFIYADRFISKRGLICLDYLPTVLLVSSITACKFCIDVGDMDLADVAARAGMKRYEMLSLERLFLSALSYSLYLSPSEMQACNDLESKLLIEKKDSSRSTFTGPKPSAITSSDVSDMEIHEIMDVY